METKEKLHKMSNRISRTKKYIATRISFETPQEKRVGEANKRRKKCVFSVAGTLTGPYCCGDLIRLTAEWNERWSGNENIKGRLFCRERGTPQAACKYQKKKTAP